MAAFNVEIGIRHDDAIDAARDASEALLRSDLTDGQRQLVVDMMNATQELNTVYWGLVDAGNRPQPAEPWDVTCSTALGGAVTVRVNGECAAIDTACALERGFASISNWHVTASRVNG